MSVVGDGVFKMYRYLDGTLRQFAMQKADFPHFVSHAWLSADLLVCGTVNGRLVVMDSTDVKREYVVFPDTPPPDAATSQFTSVHMHDQRTSLPRSNNEPSSRGRRDDMPPPADGSSTRGGSTSVRGRVSSPHMAKLQAAGVPIA